METILDKALRTAVVRLADSDLALKASDLALTHSDLAATASSPDLVDRSDKYARRPAQQEYPSYDYDDEYYENYQDYKDYSVYKPQSKDYNSYKPTDYNIYKPKDYNIYKPQSAPPWASPRPPPRRPSFPPLRPPPNRPPFIPQRDALALDRISESSSVGSGLVSWLPGLALLPIIAGLSYYFVLENAPTPVVRERGGEAVIVRNMESGDTMWRNVEHWRDGLVAAYDKAASVFSNCPEDQEETGGSMDMKCLVYERMSKLFMEHFIKLDSKESNH